jgi:DNA replication initiation complex subunit (GINS family)
MTTLHIKERITKALDNVPDALLEEVLEYVNELTQDAGSQSKRMLRIKRMLNEDDELLQRLSK